MNLREAQQQIRLLTQAGNAILLSLIHICLLFAQGQALATVGAGRPLGRSGLGQVRAASPWKGDAVSGTIGRSSGKA